MKRAKDKAARSKKQAVKFSQPSVLIKVIEASSDETDATLRELWTNLLANEMIDGSVHPEFTRILSKNEFFRRPPVGRNC